MFATVFIAIFDPRTGALAYANCGNEAPILISAGHIATLGPTGPVIGVIPNARFGVKEITMQRDDMLVAFTDGIPDATNARDELFGRERLTALVHEGSASPTDVIGRLEVQLAQFVGDAPQFDDITLLAIRRNS
jgi:sigma-B regulation protein RsbU (phosphoserine phosphatase)